MAETRIVALALAEHTLYTGVSLFIKAEEACFSVILKVICGKDKHEQVPADYI